jgi:signal peptidase I
MSETETELPLQQQRRSQEFLALIWETARVVIISLAIILPIRYYLIQPFFVNGSSMESSFHDRDYIMIDKLSYRFHDPHRGDVIVFQYPANPSDYFIKRIIGLPGETVDIKNNTITVYNVQFPDGFRIDEPYLDFGQETKNTIRMRLDDNEYFVMGDNRTHSLDSRVWGSLNRSFISGRAFVRLWPFGQTLHIKSIEYPTPSPG